MRQLVQSTEGGLAVLGALVVLLAAGIYDRWTWRRRLAAAGQRQLVLNAGAVALGGGTVIVIGSAAGTQGRQ